MSESVNQSRLCRHGTETKKPVNNGSTAIKKSSKQVPVSRYAALLDIHQSTIRRLKQDCHTYRDLLKTIVNSIDNLDEIINTGTIQILREQELLPEDECESDE
jgi:hypothetical protein